MPNANDSLDPGQKAMLFTFITDIFEDYRRRVRKCKKHKDLVKKTSEFLDELVSQLAPYAIYFTEGETDPGRRREFYKTVRIDEAMNDSSFDPADDSDLDPNDPDPYYCPWKKVWVPTPGDCIEFEET